MHISKVSVKNFRLLENVELAFETDTTVIVGRNTGVPADKQETYERNRNLFYVACSRPKKRLALLFTQKLSNTALGTLQNWVGAENISPL